MGAFSAFGDGSDWHKVTATTYLNELLTAYREHVDLLDAEPTLPDLLEAGDDVHNVSLWSGASPLVGMQRWITNQCVSFLDESKTIQGSSETDIEDLNYASWAAFASDVLGATGWRRATVWVPGTVDGTWQNDVTFSYGYFQEGDIRGPWLIEDLQKAFVALVRVQSSVRWLAENTGDGVRWNGGGTGSTWGAAQMAAEADWSDTDAEAWIPGVEYFGNHIGTNYYSCSIEARSNTPRSTIWRDPGTVQPVTISETKTPLVGGTIQFYVRAEALPETDTTFDANGLGVLEEQWASVSSATYEAEEGSVVFGNPFGLEDAIPNECDDPEGVSEPGKYQGFDMSSLDMTQCVITPDWTYDALPS